MNGIMELRQAYHSDLFKTAINYEMADEDGNNNNFIDVAKKASRDIGRGIMDRLGYSLCENNPKCSLPRRLFINATLEFLIKSFELIHHLYPYEWKLFDLWNLPKLDQFEYLHDLAQSLKQCQDNELAMILGKDYFIAPDIVVGRLPIKAEEINIDQQILAPSDNVATFTPLRSSNSPKSCYFLHASISCKWTLRSDRGQNARTEALNLIRHRKGNLPHIVAVTAEPLPTRIASLALGTGDLDCVYHFALHEMKEAIVETGNEDQMDMLDTLIIGRRLRDISDLPFDLAI